MPESIEVKRVRKDGELNLFTVNLRITEGKLLTIFHALKEFAVFAERYLSVHDSVLSTELYDLMKTSLMLHGSSLQRNIDGRLRLVPTVKSAG